MDKRISDDSRERIEDDLEKLRVKWKEYDGDYMRVYSYLAYSEIAELLDRQAAVTERYVKLRELFKFEKNHRGLVSSVEEVNQQLNERIAELQAERDELQAKVDELESRHCEWSDPNSFGDGCMLRHDEYVDELKAKVDELQAKLDAYDQTHILLPIDADGVPIHIGDNLRSDETKQTFPCRGYNLRLDGRNEKWWTVECSYDSYSGTSEYVSAKSCRHAKTRTIEDVLREIVELAQYPSASQIDDGDIEGFADEIRELIGSDGE